jgi:CBS domain-containing protein
MQARDIMTTGVITVGPDAEVAEITKCLLDNRISAVPVVEPDGRLVGIVSEGDLIRRPEMGRSAAVPGGYHYFCFPNTAQSTTSKRMVATPET